MKVGDKVRIIVGKHDGQVGTLTRIDKHPEDGSTMYLISGEGLGGAIDPNTGEPIPGNNTWVGTYMVEPATPASMVEPTTPTKKTGCFIATACYGCYHHPEVMILRQFRDQVLLNSKIGKSFISFYYTVSPPAADFIANRDTLKKILKSLLFAPVVKLVMLWLKRQSSSMA